LPSAACIQFQANRLSEMTQNFRLMRFSYCPKLVQTFTDTFPAFAESVAGASAENRRSYFGCCDAAGIHQLQGLAL
jgi:hypothetical protein